MLKGTVVVVCLVACGGSDPHAQQPQPVVRAPAKPAASIPQVGETPPPEAFTPSDVLQAGSSGGGPSTAAPPASLPQPDPKLVLDQLRDTDGGIAGMPGFAIKRRPSKKHCGGVAIVTMRSRRVAPDDEPIAAIFALEFPRALSFDMQRNDRRKASIRKFNAFVDKLTKVVGTTGKHYEAIVAGGGDAAVKVAAAARLAQMYTRLASLFARAQVPGDVRTGQFAAEKMEAFCDALLTKAEPFHAMAEQAMAVCADQAKAAPAGWWNEVCVMP